MRLSESELVALLVSHKLLTDATAGPLGEELARVTAKLDSLLSQNLPAGVNPERAFSFRWQSFSPGDPLIFRQIATSLFSRRPVSFCYYFEVTIRFTTERARWGWHEIWHPDQRREVLEDGRLLLTIPVSHEVEIIREVLKHCVHVEIVEPGWLREKIGEEISLMAVNYSRVWH